MICLAGKVECKHVEKLAHGSINGYVNTYYCNAEVYERGQLSDPGRPARLNINDFNCCPWNYKQEKPEPPTIERLNEESYAPEWENAAKEMRGKVNEIIDWINKHEEKTK